MDEKLDILIHGCGYTGQRVAKRLLAKGARVTATTRNPDRLAIAGAEIVRTSDVSKHVRPGMLVLHSIPPTSPPHLLRPLFDGVQRVVYISSTAVYGTAMTVNERTAAVPDTQRGRERLESEKAIVDGPWSTLILRPAAIYGPGRGVQESIQRGGYSFSTSLVSRIHVDDLAAHIEAALLSSLTGAYPVADAEPCSSRDITEFCMRLLKLDVPDKRLDPDRRPQFANNRRVDGLAIRKALGITLDYPSYRVGIPATLSCES